MSRQIFLNSSFFLICFFSTILIVSNLNFFLGFDLNVSIVISSFFISLFLLIFTVKNNKEILFSVLLAITVLFVTYLLAIIYFDTSWDGQGYHQETIYLLKNGWNPNLEKSNAFRIWVNLYQKGNEVIQSNIYLITNHIEAGKLLNFVYIYIAFFIFESFLNTLKLNAFLKYSISFIAVFNPVVFTQAFTYYIDGNWYLTLLISLSSLLIYFSNKRIQFIIIYVLSSVIFCSLKFSSIPIFIIFSFFAFVYNYLHQKQILIKPYIAIFLLSVICNMHPFITNVKNGNNIFHPFYGEKKIDIINQNIPEMLLHRNRVERLFISLFSETNNDMRALFSETIKIPFMFTKDELYINYDTRLGGFGFLFSGIIVITMVVAIYLLFKKNVLDKKIMFYVLTAILVTILINPASWWSRLSAQIWLLPIAIIIFGVISNNKISRLLSKFAITIFLINVIIPGCLTFIKLQQDNKTVYNFINSVQGKTITLDLSNNFGFQQYYLKFKERNIKYKIASIKNKEKLAPFTPDVYYEISK